MVLIDAARVVLAKEGYDGLTIRRVAERAEYSLGTVYGYFADKDDIVASVTETHLNREREEYMENTSSARNAVEELVNLSLCMKENLKGMNPSLLFDLQKYHHKAWRIWTEFKAS